MKTDRRNTERECLPLAPELLIKVSSVITGVSPAGPVCVRWHPLPTVRACGVVEVTEPRAVALGFFFLPVMTYRDSNGALNSWQLFGQID